MEADVVGLSGVAGTVFAPDVLTQFAQALVGKPFLDTQGRDAGTVEQVVHDLLQHSVTATVRLHGGALVRVRMI